jgi:galactokinase
VPALRDADDTRLIAAQSSLPPEVFRRARHVVGENARTLRASALARAGDVQELGQLLDASHASLRDDFEVSSPALDAIVSIARRQPGCVGARMTGAGFGGCAIALVLQDAVTALAGAVSAAYAGATSLTPAIFPCRASAGASLVDPATFRSQA